MLVSLCHCPGLNLTLNCDDFFRLKTVTILINIISKCIFCIKLNIQTYCNDDEGSYNGTRDFKEFLHLKCFEQIDNDFWG